MLSTSQVMYLWFREDEWCALEGAHCVKFLIRLKLSLINFLEPLFAHFKARYQIIDSTSAKPGEKKNGKSHLFLFGEVGLSSFLSEQFPIAVSNLRGISIVLAWWRVCFLKIRWKLWDRSEPLREFLVHGVRSLRQKWWIFLALFYNFYFLWLILGLFIIWSFELYLSIFDWWRQFKKRS